MNRKEIREALGSDNVDMILDGLNALKAERETEPTEQIVRACERLARHSDADVRAEAIAVVGIHWAIDTSFASILEAARHDRDLDVRVVGARALVRYVDSRRDEVSKALAAIVRRETRSDLRAVAYIGLLHAEGRITPSERATMPEDIDAFDVDLGLLRRWT